MTVYSAIKRQYLPDDLLSIYTSSQQIATIIIKATIFTLITTIIIATFIIIIILHTSTQTITTIIFCSYLIYKQIILRHRLVQVGLRGVLLVHRAPWIQQFSESHYFLGHPLVTVAVYTHFLLTNLLHHFCNFV